ncbi:MFS transporter [Phytohabitans houttuyneae]|uniref:MFS transporter n=1 Tax=Phytohabitans houttuyneae TaxID=1076126 RepID=A0A6V8KL76_9ACTN|nr:MFS transporter [Phytohabitans houttuyneae]GFJ81415.1 MFS transporter [Phytohabitans houttuyneae]
MTAESDAHATTLAEREPPANRFPRGALAVVMVGTFVTVLDYFVANVAVSSIQEDLQATSAQIQGVIVGYGVAFSAGMITGGRLGDLYGRRRLFVLGLALFLLTSAACGLAPSATTLVVARIAQGAAAALMVPQVLGIVSTICTTDESRARAFNIYGLVIGMAAVFGQVIGGLLITLDVAAVGWRAIFLINVPVCGIALVAARRVVPESRNPRAARLDLPGAVLVTAALGAVVFFFLSGQELGWPWWSWLCLAAAVPLLAAFVRHARRSERLGGSPVIEPALFRERSFTAGVTAMVVYFMALGSFFFLLAVYLQDGHGLSPLESGLMFFTLGTGFFISSMVFSKLAAKVGHRLIVFGPLTVAVGYLLVILVTARTGVSGSEGWLILPLVIAGVGMGMTTGPLTNAVLTGVAPDHAASAAGVANTAQEGGAAVGVAIAGAVFFPVLGELTDRAAYPHAFQTALVPLIVFCVCAAALVALMSRRSAQPAAA